MKHKKNQEQIKLYLLRSDIKELNAEYSQLYKDVKNDPNYSTEQIQRSCEILLQKYNFDIEELSAFRETEYLKRKAETEAKNAEQIPWRRGWWWRLIFQPLTNRAQDIIEEQAKLDAEALFAPIEKKLDERAEKLYVGTGKKLSRRKRQRLMNKYLKLRDKLISSNVRSSDAALDAESSSPTNSATSEASTAPATPEPPANVADVQSGAEPPELPARKSRKTQ